MKSIDIETYFLKKISALNVQILTIEQTLANGVSNTTMINLIDKLKHIREQKELSRRHEFNLQDNRVRIFKNQ